MFFWGDSLLPGLDYIKDLLVAISVSEELEFDDYINGTHYKRLNTEFPTKRYTQCCVLITHIRTFFVQLVVKHVCQTRQELA